jgi:hypothetical protein
MCTAGVIVDSEPTPKSRRTAVDDYLRSSLGVQGLQVPPAAAADWSGGGVRVLHRRQLGSAVHIFSHIRQTMHAEELVLLAPMLADVCSTAAAAAVAAAGGCDGSSGQTETAAGAADAAATAASKGAGATGKKRKAGTAAAGAVASASSGEGAAVAGGSNGSERPQMRWVSAADISKQGLTSGVRKVLQLSLK